MPGLLRRQTTPICFFCNTTLKTLPPNPRAFRCPECGCSNRYDTKGEIMSDEPAMHEEGMNAKSFSKRASQSSTRLPTEYSKGVFCRTCTTNQMLITNLLANYLPRPDSPDYDAYCQQLPAYQASLNARYPPICDTCAPQVEEEIKSKEHMARTSALGGWLKQNSTKGKEKMVNGANDTLEDDDPLRSSYLRQREELAKGLFMWRVRGGLWWTSLFVVLGSYYSAAFRYTYHLKFVSLIPILPLLSFTSILWTAWDRTWGTLRQAELRKRPLRVRGKKNYNVLQTIVWLFRNLTAILVTLAYYRRDLDYLHLYKKKIPSQRARTYFLACFISELLLFVVSQFVLRVVQPPSVRLIDPNSHLRLSVPPPDHPPSSSTAGRAQSLPPRSTEQDLLSALNATSVSNPMLSNAAPPAANPIFGLPSFFGGGGQSPQTPARRKVQKDPDAMDWTPTGPQKRKPAGIGEDGDDETDTSFGSWLRPQRFFPPEQPTGLEPLFPKFRLDDSMDVDGQHARRGRWQKGWWWLAASLSLVLPLGAVAWKVWEKRRGEFGMGA